MPRAFGTEMSITRRRAGRLAWAIAIRAVYSARSATSHACCTEAPQAMMPWRARSITCVSAGAAATAAAPPPEGRRAPRRGGGEPRVGQRLLGGDGHERGRLAPGAAGGGGRRG